MKKIYIILLSIINLYSISLKDLEYKAIKESNIIKKAELNKNIVD